MDDLSPEILEKLLKAAREVQQRAHAPYSKFLVGAALLTDKGRIITGCNVENASYGLTVCAERVALGRAVAEDAGKPVACLVVGPTAEPLTPCGACRQSLLEFNPSMRVICVGRDGRRIDTTAGELLPHSFGADELEKPRE
ncbi:MAG: cytidine deaminase [Candidatus Sumerlaeia bacterium]|nr:cytidine deaminase [Candidatus Sumerlaeia bacterium]